jgi:hypothetical protein
MMVMEPIKFNGIKKKIHIVYINDFFPELFKITYPTIKLYAEKNGYEINLITERKFPNWHIHYEKMQIYEDGKNYHLNVLVDADLMIHPDYPDIVTLCPETHIGMMDAYDIDKKCELNGYFIRDGRNVGVASNFVASTYLTHDIWKPLKITPEQGKKITFVREGDIDEYCLSHNLAKYGLKYCGLTHHKQLQKMILHTGTGNRKKSLELANNTLNEWRNQ